MKFTPIFCSLLASISILEAAWTPKQLPSGSISTSPNGEFLVTYSPDQLQIRDKRTNKDYKSITVLPVFFITWTGDSQTMVVVEHMAGGSTVVLAHFTGNEWESFTVSPPGKQYDNYSVVDLRAKDRTVHIAYKVVGRTTKEPEYYVSTFDVDPSTGKFSSVTRKPVSVEKFIEINQLGEP